jgi:hypothetical protein
MTTMDGIFRYYDFIRHAPYPKGDKNNQISDLLKIPAPDIHYALFYYRLLQYDIRELKCIKEYQVNRKGSSGYTRISYKLTHLYFEHELDVVRNVFYKSKNRNIKNRIQ